jgi:hypothetical protein
MTMSNMSGSLRLEALSPFEEILVCNLEVLHQMCVLFLMLNIIGNQVQLVFSLFWPVPSGLSSLVVFGEGFAAVICHIHSNNLTFHCLCLVDFWNFWRVLVVVMSFL